MKRIKVTLRKKTMSKGRLSLYLDFYPPYFNTATGTYSRREFLRIHLIAKPRNQFEKNTNIENMHTAELMCTKRQNEVNKEFIYTPFEIEQIRKDKVLEGSFVKYFKKQAEYREGPNKLIWHSSIAHFEKFADGRDFRFRDINADLVEDYKEHLLKAKSMRDTGKRLSRNTALSYFNKVKATLRKAYKEQILASDVNAAVNGITESESMRNYLTLEEAGALSRTPCENDIVGRASLFSILTGLRYSDIEKLTWGDVQQQLPEKPGVYYFHDRTGKVVYVGKAKNIKKRVSQHFGGHKITPQRQHFMRDIHSISHEPCATEFMALLLECCEIRKLWPAHNRALKRFEPRFGLYHYEARSGYQYLAVGKLAKGQACVELFHTQYDGVNLLLSLAGEFGINHRFCHYGIRDAGDLIIRKDSGDLPDLSQHNLKIDRALEYLADSRPSFGIVDKGRSADERSCVWVEKGHFYGMGYLPSDAGIREASELRDYVTPYASNGYLMQLINAYAQKYPGKVVRPTVDGN